jgi:hypothetical protein
MQSIYQLSLLFLFCLSSISLAAQVDITIQEETRSMDKGSANALILKLPNTSYKKVNKLWGKYVRNFKGKTKYNRKINEYFSDDATVKEMSDNTIDITAKIYNRSDESTELAVWFNLGVVYLSSSEYPDRYVIAEKLLYDFGLLVSADIIEAQIETEEKQLVAYTDQLKSIQQAKLAEENNIKKQQEIIRKAETSIQESEKTIEQNITEQTKQKEIISEQQKLLEELKQKLNEVRKRK